MRSRSGGGGSLSMRPVRSGNGSTTGGVGVVRPSGDQRSSKGDGARACLCSSGPEAEGEAERLSRFSLSMKVTLVDSSRNVVS